MSDDLDWAWAKRTSGNLTARQQRQLTRVILAEVPGALFARARYLLGQRGPGSTDLASVPDSRFAREAQDHARSELEPWVLEHSYRTYFFARALTELTGVKIDPELSYVSALLHDLKLGKPTPGQCFGYTGGLLAEQAVIGWGAGAQRAEAVGAAACGHATPGADTNLSDPGGFVLAGSMTDCIGRRLGELDPAWVTKLFAQHPRHDFKRRLPAALRAEAAAVPHGRIHLANQVAQLPLMVRLAPYPE